MKNVVKKTIAILFAGELVLTTIFGILNPSMFTIKASAEQTAGGVDSTKILSTDELILYKADNYSEDDSPNYRAIESMLNFSTPSELIVDKAKTNGLKESIDWWEKAHWITKPSSATGLDKESEEQGFYEAIILNVFISQSLDSNQLMKLGKDITKETNSVLSEVKSATKLSDDLDNINTLSDEQKKDISNALKEIFKNNHPKLSGISSFWSDADDILKSVNTLEAGISRLETYTYLCEMSDSQKNVLWDLHNRCSTSNTALRTALSETAIAMDNYDSAIMSVINNTATGLLVDVCKTLINSGYSAVIDNIPILREIYLTAKVGTFIGDTFCSAFLTTDETVESYRKMVCLDTFNELLREEVRNDRELYSSYKNVEKANDFLASVDALFASGCLSCDYAGSFAEAVYGDADYNLVKKAISKLYGRDTKNDYAKLKTNIDSIKRSYESIYGGLDTDLKYNLETDYPATFNALYGSDTYKPLTAISSNVSQISMVKGSELCILQYLNFNPSDATDMRVKVTSSKPKKVSVVDENGVIVSKAVGSAVIKVKTLDGNHSISIPVKVTKGQVAKKIKMPLKGKSKFVACHWGPSWGVEEVALTIKKDGTFTGLDSRPNTYRLNLKGRFVGIKKIRNGEYKLTLGSLQQTKTTWAWGTIETEETYSASDALELNDNYIFYKKGFPYNKLPKPVQYVESRVHPFDKITKTLDNIIYDKNSILVYYD